MVSKPYFGVSATRYSMFARLIPVIENPAGEEANSFWVEFVDKYTPLIYGVCRSFHLQNSDAEDLTQGTILKVISKLKEGKFHYDSRHRFRAWLATVTGNLIRDELRRAKRTRHDCQSYLDTIAEESLAEAVQEQVNLEYLLGQALERLQQESPSNQWKTFEVRVLGEKSAAATATELGMTSGNVDVICSRMKVKLKKIWHEIIRESHEQGIDIDSLANQALLVSSMD